ncbi:hypothetical protein H9P43_007051 [Blastocladiella emersonii ATCC 22665]|nr:hypothetical protein H9P43_007051 [Blastocladiella emersonii ATCC 22665]
MSYASAVEYCRDLVTQHDHEHYLSSLFLPADVRPISWGLRAFNYELASVRDQARDDTLGRMRFQFWRDTLDKAYAGEVPQSHPVAIVLAAGIKHHGLSVHRLKRVVAGRESNFLTRQYARIEDLEEYGEATASGLMYLHLELLGVKSLDVDHLASHLGKAAAIATLLRGTPFHLRSRLFYLPSEVCAKHGVAAEQVMREGPSEALSAAVFEVATRANDHLITARTHVKEDGLDARAVPALLPAVATARWLQRLEKADFDLFNGALHTRDAWLPWHLWKASKLRKF